MKWYLRWGALFTGIYFVLNLIWIGGERYYAESQFHQKRNVLAKEVFEELEKGLLGAGLSLLYKRRQPDISMMRDDTDLLFHGEKSIYTLPYFEGFLNDGQTSLNFKIDSEDFHFPKIPDNIQVFVVAFTLKEMADIDKALKEHLRPFHLKHTTQQTLSVPNLMLVVAFVPHTFLTELQKHGVQLILTAFFLIFVIAFFFFSFARKEGKLALEKAGAEKAQKSKKRFQDSLFQLRIYQKEIVAHFLELTTSIKEISSILLNNETNLTNSQKTGFLRQLNELSTKIPKHIEDHEKQHVDGTELLYQVRELLYADLKAKHLFLKLKIDDGLNLYGHRFFLKILFLNLFSRSLYCVPEKSAIEVSLSKRSDGKIVFQLHDKGFEDILTSSSELKNVSIPLNFLEFQRLLQANQVQIENNYVPYQGNHITLTFQALGQEKPFKKENKQAGNGNVYKLYP